MGYIYKITNKLNNKAGGNYDRAYDLINKYEIIHLMKK